MPSDESSMAVDFKHHRFTLAQYERMIETGVLTDRDRVELIEGEIIEMPPIGDPHAGTCNRVAHVLITRLGGRAVVAVANPVALPIVVSMPQPDMAVLKPRSTFYADRRPQPEDTFFVVEVMDSSTRYDRRIKAPLYARAGVPELWLVDIPRMIVEVLREPREASYQSLRTMRRGESVSPLAFPDVSFNFAELLG